jgi:invasion protein IalB
MKNRTVSGLELGWSTPSRRLTAIAIAGALGVAAPDVFAQATQEPAQQQQAPQQTPEQQAPPQQTPQGEAAPTERTITEHQFKDWMVRCGRQSEQSPQVCQMEQQTTDKEGRTVMFVVVGEVPASSDLGLLIILPLGILLPAGVTLQIDSAAPVPLQVDRCERQGCRIEMLLEPDLLNRFKAGTKATVFFEAADPQGERQRLGVPISLLGFTAALNQVTG